MGIPKKGSRKIVVGERAFRWLLKGYARLYGDTPQAFTFVAQEDVPKPGHPLTAELVSKKTVSEWDTHKAAVRPVDAAQIIKTGLSQGWDPTHRGAAFELSTPLDLTEFEICPR